MTNPNVRFTGPAVATYQGYSSGSFDGSGSLTGYVDLTLIPVTDGVSPPSSNLSYVLGSFGGMKLTLSPVPPLPTDATRDGSHTTLQYSDALDDDSGRCTGHTQILVSSNATLNIGQLRAGLGVSFSSLAGQDKSLSVGEQVAAAGGTYIDLYPGSSGSVYIEAMVQALTLVDHLAFDGKQTLVVDLASAGSALYFAPVTLTADSGPVQATLVTPWAASMMNYFPGVLVTGIAPAALQARMTRNGAYLTFV